MITEQKIKNLNWFDKVNKEKEILLEINSNSEQLEGRLEVLEQSSGGGSQDLQSVLNQGSSAVLTTNLNISGNTKKIYFGTEYNNNLDSVHMSLSGNSYWDIGQRISIYRNDDKASLNFDGDGANFKGTSTDGLKSGTIYLGGGSVRGEAVLISGTGKSVFADYNPNTNKAFIIELDAINNSALFKDTNVTAKGLQYEGNYSTNYTNRSLVDKEYVDTTLSSLSNINLDSKVYANNTSAISGGLLINDIYRTVTGELRIVV